MEEALFETARYREFVGLRSVERIPDRVSVLRFRHLLEEHQLAERILATVNATLTDKGLMLREGTVVDATLIAAPSSTNNKDGQRDPEMHQTKKDNQWHFGMKPISEWMPIPVWFKGEIPWFATLKTPNSSSCGISRFRGHRCGRFEHLPGWPDCNNTTAI